MDIARDQKTPQGFIAPTGLTDLSRSRPPASVEPARATASATRIGPGSSDVDDLGSSRPSGPLRPPTTGGKRKHKKGKSRKHKANKSRKNKTRKNRKH